MAADFIRANYSAKLDDMMGDDSALFNDIMRGPAKAQPAQPQRRGLQRPEDRPMGDTDAEIFADMFRDQAGPAPPRAGYRSQ